MNGKVNVTSTSSTLLSLPFVFLSLGGFYSGCRYHAILHLQKSRIKLRLVDVNQRKAVMLFQNSDKISKQRSLKKLALFPVSLN